MQYLHLVYLSDSMLKQIHRDEPCPDHNPVGGLALQGFRAGAGHLNGNLLVTDGPFVETKEYRVSS
ncbi:MAG TPA: hypothetical protein VKZ91_04180 [Woeseiaceae bacterium]|nr:hypothetical protein [Woeseiaceae bacterium]